MPSQHLVDTILDIAASFVDTPAALVDMYWSSTVVVAAVVDTHMDSAPCSDAVVATIATVLPVGNDLVGNYCNVVVVVVVVVAADVGGD